MFRRHVALIGDTRSLLCVHKVLRTFDAARRLRVTAATEEQMVRVPPHKAGVAMSIRGHVTHRVTITEYGALMLDVIQKQEPDASHVH